ncbi:ABC transporter ATP-binding protein [Sulfuritalea hydrogenivorans]|uniref:Transport system ATP-binding protein n=1 Tax=Sulfuritalea hydrogenivorans sk43H TaxID=1223802 RepID=W0SJF5_9PROT|nr:ABC transporter ATP-binding protein [Sulfuritalea hydrogenivorans]MDK9712921.1 ABC transporter ATP-binding protein [Sulfuritalea sp.]BAO30233.1 transport system ATP-binding protein [Sulfuritalea hydrogenivorans sk43H]
MPLLEVDHVSHAYGKHAVVRDLSFDLAPGQIACLLGSSGCGKTTMLRLIAGFEMPAAGSIRLNGVTIASAKTQLPAEARRIGMVFQDYALFPHLSIADNIGFGLREQSALATRRRIEEMLELIGLSDRGARYPHELSGGQQQRVALARALAPQPHLLLLDEPFSNLDVELRERLSLEVRDILKRANMAAMLVTHDQNEAFAVADVVGIMREGRIEQWDTPYNLYHRPATRHVADFIGQGVFLPGEVMSRQVVKVELGQLDSDVPMDCGPSCAECQRGCRLDVLLRPDDVVHDDDSGVKAEVIAKAFRGAEFLYTLRLASGAQVLSLVPSHHNHAIGEKIGIRLVVDHVVTFPQG